MGNGADFLLQVEVWSGRKPPSKITVGEGSNERTAFIDDKNDAVLIIVYLFQCMEDRLRFKDKEIGDFLTDQHVYYLQFVSKSFQR